MSALAWLCRLRRSASRPESSAATTRHLRRVATVALLLGLAAGAQAQTIDSMAITEGETKTFTVSGIPSSWTGNVDTHFGGAAVLAGCSFTLTNPNWDVCENIFSCQL